MSNVTAKAAPDLLDRRDFRASDLDTLVGLTYRQLNDWEERADVLTSERESAEGWRKFTGEQVMALAVCANARRQFSLPLEDVGKLYQWLTGKRSDDVKELADWLGQKYLDGMHANPKLKALLNSDNPALTVAKSNVNRHLLQECVRYKLSVLATPPITRAYRLAHVGLATYLLTDLKSSWMILEEGHFVEWLGKRKMQKPIILCPLNATFNEVLKRAGQPVLELDRVAPSFWATWQKLQDRPDLTATERKVIDLIRARDYQSVTVHVKGGQMLEAEQDTEEPPTEGEPSKREKQILRVLGCGDFETVTLKVHRGKVIRLNHKRPIKLNAATERT